MYDIRPGGSRGSARFKCEVRVTGIPYFGVGNSGSKKDAQANAAYDFCQYLIRENHFPAAEFPFSNAGVSGGNDAGPMGMGMKQEYGTGALPGGIVPPHMRGGREREGGEFGGYGKYGAGASKEGGNIADWQRQKQERVRMRS